MVWRREQAPISFPLSLWERGPGVRRNGCKDQILYSTIIPFLVTFNSPAVSLYTYTPAGHFAAFRKTIWLPTASLPLTSVATRLPDALKTSKVTRHALVFQIVFPVELIKAMRNPGRPFPAPRLVDHIRTPLKPHLGRDFIDHRIQIRANRRPGHCPPPGRFS